MIEHVVFDWDGTLADTYPSILAAYAYVLKKMGMGDRFDIDKLIKITSSMPNREILEAVFGARKDEAKKIYYEFMSEHHADGIKATDGAREVLEFCRKKGINCYLISNKTNVFGDGKKAYLSIEIEKLGFMKYFKKVIGAGEFREDKPSKIAVQSLFDGEVPKPETILVVGDGEADIKVSESLEQNGKRPKVVIYDPKGSFVDPGFDYKVREFKEVAEVVGGI